MDSEDKEREDREAGQGFKIVDRRRFDSEGNTRGSEAAPPREGRPERPAGAAAERRSARPAAEKPDRMSESAGTGEITFSSFVMSLATQVLMQLGEIKPPPGMEIPVDKAAAKQTIEILSMLQEKTHGNLDDQEAQLIEEILHNLRINFVAHT